MISTELMMSMSGTASATYDSNLQKLDMLTSHKTKRD